MKYGEKWEKLLAENRRMAKKLIALTSNLDICRQKCVTIEAAFDLSQKLVQHLKTENQLLRSAAPDSLFTNHVHYITPEHTDVEANAVKHNDKVTEEVVDGPPTQMDVTSNENQNINNQNVFKSDLIAIEYEKEIKELRDVWQLLCILDREEVVISKEDELKANKYLTESSDSEPETEPMDIDDAMSTSKMSDISESRPSKCKYCGRKFADGSALSDHKTLHKSSDGKQIRCAEDLCGFQFESKRDLQKHLKTVHKNHGKAAYSELKAKFKSSDSLKCRECSQEFTDVEELRTHQRTSHNLKSTFKCKFSGCDKTFEKVSELRAHEGVHRQQHSKIEIKVTPTKPTPKPEANTVLTNAENTPKSAPTPPPPSVAKTRDFPCQFQDCKRSFVHKTSLKRHIDKCHSNEVIAQQAVQSIPPVGLVVAENGVPTPVSVSPGGEAEKPKEDLSAQLQMLQMFYAHQQKRTEL